MSSSGEDKDFDPAQTAGHGRVYFHGGLGFTPAAERGWREPATTSFSLVYPYPVPASAFSIDVSTDRDRVEK